MKISELMSWGKLSTISENINLDEEISNFKIDSRSISSGDVFVALMGNSMNGEKFVASAFEKGASYAIVSNSYSMDGVDSDKLFFADDTLNAFQEIGRQNLLKSKAKVVAITGSVGKTTTKDIVAHILSSKYRVFKSEGNYNTQTGIPLMLTKITDEFDIAVIEMGMDRFGDIENYCKMTEHNIAVITNIGTSHMEYFGSKQKIFEGKLQIATNFDENSTLVVNCDDEYLSSIKNVRYRLSKVGNCKDSDIFATDVKMHSDGVDFVLNYNAKKYDVNLPILGAHNVVNSLLAISVAQYFNIEMNKIVDSLKTVKNTYMRLQKVNKNGIMYIIDCYNSSLESMRAAVKVIENMNSNRKIMVIGDVYETGSSRDAVHREIGEILNSIKLDMVYFVGEYIKAATESYNGKFEYDEKKDKIIDKINKYIEVGDTILFKASRGVELESIVEATMYEIECRRKNE